MKITLNKSQTLSHLKLLADTAASKTTLPITTVAVLTAKDGKLTGMATDLEIGVRVQLDAEAEGDGAIAVNAQKLFSTVNNMPAPSVTLETAEANRLVIKSGHSVYRLPGQDPKEFPELKFDGEGEDILIDADSFVELIDKTVFIVRRDEQRRAFAEGTNFIAAKGVITASSTDGHRVSRMSIDTHSEINLKSVTLPKRSLVLVMQAIESEAQEIVSLKMQESAVVVEVGDASFMIRWLDCEYPDIERVIPRNTPIFFEVPADPLYSALKRLHGVVVGREAVTVVVQGDSLVLKYANDELGEGEERVEASGNGKEIKFGINHRYLIGRCPLPS